jgi:hypothetical protein
MTNINLSGKNYPLRFDMRALKEYKSISKNDVLVQFDNNTDNVVTLTYCAIKSGYLFEKQTFTITEEEVSSMIELSDISKITKALIEQLGINPSEKGEIVTQGTN